MKRNGNTQRAKDRLPNLHKLTTMHALVVQLEMIEKRIGDLTPTGDDADMAVERRRWSRVRGFLKAASSVLVGIADDEFEVCRQPSRSCPPGRRRRLEADDEQVDASRTADGREFRV